jgi:hypothetical protein
MRGDCFVRLAVRGNFEFIPHLVQLCVQSLG